MTQITQPQRITEETDGFERIDRYQTLDTGTYWRATKTVEASREYGNPRSRTFDLQADDGEDLVLLLVNVRMFDGVAHTVELLSHPGTGGQAIYQVRVNDFLDGFEPAHDGEEVRQREMQAIHQRVADIQTELSTAQQNPALIDAYVAKEMEARAALDPDLALSKNTAMTVSRGAVTPSTFITSRMGTDVAQSLQTTAKRYHAIADIKSKWLREKTEAIGDTLKELTPYFAEKAQVALASTRGVRDYADELMKSLQSLDLYVGKGVEFETLTEGEHAPPEEALTITQRKIFVDEEFSAWADVNSEFDYSSLTRFDEALAANASLRDQIFPAPRCIVSMAVRRNSVQYGDGMHLLEQARRNVRNKMVFLMVRDGERIHRVYSSEPSHEFARRTFPTTNEIGALFTGYDGEKITFSDLRFTNSAEALENVALSYKRLLILLCGLDHREQLFGRFYPEAEALSFISMQFQAKYMRFIADDDEALMIAGGIPLPPVFEWMKEKNSYLRSGSRVMCLWQQLTTKEAAPGLAKSGVAIARSEGSSGVRIAYKDGADICVDVMAERPYGRGTNNAFKAKVMLTRKEWDDGSGYLCLDAAKATELRPYIFNRRDRVHHVAYIRLFKQALAYLEVEEAQQAQATDYLRTAVTSSPLFAGMDSDAVSAIVKDAVRTWRASQRGELLPSVADKAALNPVLDLIHRDATSASLLQRVEQYATDEGLMLLRVALAGSSKVALYCAPSAAQRASFTTQFNWVKRFALDVRKTKLAITSEKWVWLQKDVNDAAEKTLSDYPELDNWLNAKAEPCTVKSLESAIAAVNHWPDVFRQRVSGALEAGRWGHGDFEQMFDDVLEQSMNGPGKMIASADWTIPFGVYWSDKGLRVIAAHINAEAALYRFADKEQRAIMKARYAGRFNDRKHGLSLLERAPHITYKVLAADAINYNCAFPHEVTEGWNRLATYFSDLNTVEVDDGEENWFGRVTRRTKTIEIGLSVDALFETLLRHEKGNRTILSPYAMRGNSGAITELFNVPIDTALDRDGVARAVERKPFSMFD